jgi:hypothetical protein
MVPVKIPVVLDKSYLQGAPRAHMHDLAASHRLLMSEALLYELLSKPADYRTCFSKFPAVDNPVDIVLHVGGYLKKEIEGRRPAPKPSSRAREVKFRFNPRLLDADYVLPDEAAFEIERQRQELLADVQTLKERALGMPDFFPDVFPEPGRVNGEARAEAETLIAQPSSLLDFYGQLRAPKGMKRFPPRKLLTEKWAIYRHLQVQFLFALDLYARFGPALAAPLPAASEEQIEHDVLDSQYMLIGVLEGAFATQERKLQRWFGLLRPDGLLLRRETANPVAEKRCTATSRERLRWQTVTAVVEADVHGLVLRCARAGHHHTVLGEADLQPAATRLGVPALGGDVDEDRARGAKPVGHHLGDVAAHLAVGFAGGRVDRGDEKRPQQAWFFDKQSGGALGECHLCDRSGDEDGDEFQHLPCPK